MVIQLCYNSISKLGVPFQTPCTVLIFLSKLLFKINPLRMNLVLVKLRADFQFGNSNVVLIFRTGTMQKTLLSTHQLTRCWNMLINKIVWRVKKRSLSLLKPALNISSEFVQTILASWLPKLGRDSI